MGSMFNILAQHRGSIFVDVPRQVFGWIDAGIYWFMSSVYGLIEDLARVQIFDQSTLNGFYNKIYLLLSIFMLFKISFSIVSYVLDPSKFSDKSAGFGKIITNVLIMFVMLLSAPVAFKYLTKLQNAILDDEVILNFLFGDAGTTAAGDGIILGDEKNCKDWATLNSDNLTYNGLATSTVKNNGDYLAITIYRSFYSIASPTYTKGNGYSGSEHSLIEKNGANSAVNYMCNWSNTDANVSDMVSFINAYYDEGGGKSLTGYYVIEYRWGVATAVGAFALLMLINIAFEIAVRAIKLGFYQLIAPVPIISYIDPKSGKNGMFSKYMTDLGKTWANLFVRLFSVYFVVFVIKEFNMHFIDNLGEVNSSKFFINLFVVIGALMFAKQLPQLLEELFPGMKMGKMQLNPLKNIAENAIGGKYIAGAAVGAAAMGARGMRQAGSNLYAFGRNRSNLKKGIAEAQEKGDIEKEAKLREQLRRNNWARGLGTGLGGLAGGASRGFKSGFKTGETGSANIFKNQKEDLKSANTKRNNRAAINDYNAELKRQYKAGNINDDEYKNAKYGFFERNVTENLDKSAGVKNSYGGYGYYNNKISELERKIENNNDAEHSARDAVANYSSNHGISAQDLYNYHENNKDKTSVQLEQELMKKYTSADGEYKCRTNKRGQIIFENNERGIAAKESYERDRKILAGYKEQKAQIESIYKIDEETKELKKQKKQYQEMVDSRPDSKGSDK